MTPETWLLTFLAALYDLRTVGWAGVGVGALLTVVQLGHLWLAFRADRRASRPPMRPVLRYINPASSKSARAVPHS